MEHKAKIKEKCVFSRYCCPKGIQTLNFSDPEAQIKSPQIWEGTKINFLTSDVLTVILIGINMLETRYYQLTDKEPLPMATGPGSCMFTITSVLGLARSPFQITLDF